MARASKRERKRVATIFATQRKDMMIGAGAGAAGGVLVGAFHRMAETKGFSTTVHKKFPIGWATLAGLGISAVGLARRRRWSVPVVMAGTGIAAADLAITVKDWGKNCPPASK